MNISIIASIIAERELSIRKQGIFEPCAVDDHVSAHCFELLQHGRLALIAAAHEVHHGHCDYHSTTTLQRYM
jgi:hypothetical protein